MDYYRTFYSVVDMNNAASDPITSSRATFVSYSYVWITVDLSTRLHNVDPVYIAYLPSLVPLHCLVFCLASCVLPRQS